SKSLVPVIAVLVVGRIIGWVAHLLLCLGVAPELRRSIAWERSVVGPLMRFGGWMTVTNVTGSVLLYMDRFLIGSLISVGVLIYYITPVDVVIWLMVIFAAVVGVLFPVFAVSFMQNPERTSLLLVRGTKSVFLCVFPIVLTIVTFALEGLRLWLGNAFAQNGASVLRWLAA